MNHAALSQPGVRAATGTTWQHDFSMSLVRVDGFLLTSDRLDEHWQRLDE